MLATARSIVSRENWKRRCWSLSRLAYPLLAHLSTGDSTLNQETWLGLTANVSSAGSNARDMWMKSGAVVWGFFCIIIDIIVIVVFLLAHLSRRLIWWAYRIGRPPSSVVVVVVVSRRPHSLNIFSSETTGPIKVKFHMELLWGRGTKTNICSNGPSHMTKMATMPIYGKNLKKFSSLEPKGGWPWNLVCSIGCSSTTKFAQMMTLCWPWPILRQGHIWSLMLLYGKKVKIKMDFSETVLIYDLKRATDDQSDKKFLLTLSPGGCMSPCPMPIYT